MAAQRPLRKKIFISTEIQGQLTVHLGLYWIMYHLVLWHALFGYHYLNYRLSSNYGSLSFGEIYWSFVGQYAPIIIVTVAMLPVFVSDLIRLTHRIAGPVVRFKHALTGMIAGEAVRPIKLRKGDLMIELETPFNEYIAQYEQRRRESLPAADSTDSGAADSVSPNQLTEQQAELVAELTQAPQHTADVPVVG